MKPFYRLFAVSAEIPAIGDDHPEASRAVVAVSLFLLNKSTTVMRGFYSQFRRLAALQKS